MDANNSSWFQGVCEAAGSIPDTLLKLLSYPCLHPNTSHIVQFLWFNIWPLTCSELSLSPDRKLMGKRHSVLFLSDQEPFTELWSMSNNGVHTVCLVRRQTDPGRSHGSSKPQNWWLTEPVRTSPDFLRSLLFPRDTLLLSGLFRANNSHTKSQ